MSGFILAKRTIGFKLEDTPYAAETLTSASYNIRAYDVQYDPDIAMYARKIAHGDFGRDASVAGKRSVTITFKVDIAWSGTAATAPAYFGCLRACGLKQTTHGATGVSLVTDAGYTAIPATIEVVERDEGASPVQLVIKGAGCMGNARINVNNVGEPASIEFEFKGRLESISDRAFASQIIPTGFDTPLPEAVLTCTTSLFTVGQKFNKVTIDLGNTVELWTDPRKTTGIEGAHIVDQNPMMEIDPDMTLIATDDPWSRHTGNTLGAMSTSIGQHIVLSAPKAQIVQAYKPGEREGHATNNLKYELKPNLGNDEFRILQGSE